MHGYFVSSVGILSFLLHIKWYSPTINMEIFALLYSFVCALSGLCTMQYSVYLVSMEMFLLNKIFKYLKKFWTKSVDRVICWIFYFICDS